MNKVKKYWKEILIGLLVIFSLNKCSTSCSRGSIIKKQNIEISTKDSIIKVQSDSLNILLPGNTSRGFLKTNPLAPPYSLISDKIKPIGLLRTK